MDANTQTATPPAEAGEQKVSALGNFFKGFLGGSQKPAEPAAAPAAQPPTTQIATGATPQPASTYEVPQALAKMRADIEAGRDVEVTDLLAEIESLNKRLAEVSGAASKVEDISKKVETYSQGQQDALTARVSKNSESVAQKLSQELGQPFTAQEVLAAWQHAEHFIMQKFAHDPLSPEAFAYAAKVTLAAAGDGIMPTGTPTVPKLNSSSTAPGTGARSPQEAVLAAWQEGLNK